MAMISNVSAIVRSKNCSIIRKKNFLKIPVPPSRGIGGRKTFTFFRGIFVYNSMQLCSLIPNISLLLKYELNLSEKGSKKDSDFGSF